MRTTQAEGPASLRRRARRGQLRFPDADLERQFRLSYRVAVRPWIRMSLLVALGTTLGFTVIDHWLLVGPRLARPDIWRFGLQLPLFGVGSVLMAVEATPAQLPIILVDSTRADAAAAADGVRRAVAGLGIAHTGSSTRPYVTVSIGVTTVEPGGVYSHERAVRLADVALYATKAQGRDGWSFKPPEDEVAVDGPYVDELQMTARQQPPEERQAAGLLKTAS